MLQRAPLVATLSLALLPALAGCATYSVARGDPRRPQAPVTAREADAPQTRRPEAPLTVDPLPPAPYDSVPTWYAKYDPLRYFVAVEQQAPQGYIPVADRRPASFPGVPVASAVGVDILAADGACRVLAPDGTFCPEVRRQVAPLSAAQLEVVLKTAEAARPTRETEHGRRSRPLLRCGDYLASAIVLFDAKQIPVAYVGLDADCVQWELSPSTPLYDGGLSVMFEDEQRAMFELCRDLHLACGGPERDPDAPPPPRYTPEVARRLLPALLELAPPVDGTRLLSSLDASERRLLCVWNHQRARIARDARLGGTLTWTLDAFSFRQTKQSPALLLQSVEECSHTLASTDETVQATADEQRRLIEGLANGHVDTETPTPWGWVVVPAAEVARLDIGGLWIQP